MKPTIPSGNDDSSQSEVVSSDDPNPSVSVAFYQRDDLRTKLLRFVASTGVANTDLDELGWMLDHYRPGPLWLLGRTPRLAKVSVREPLFSSLDSNHDGAIDKDEAAAISKILMAADRDRRESTSWQEVQQFMANQAVSEFSASQDHFDWAWVDSQTNPTKTINVRLNINHSEPSASQTHKHVLSVSFNDSATQQSNMKLRHESKRVDCALEPPARIHFHGYTDSTLMGAAAFQCSLAAAFRSNQLWAAMETNGNGSIGLKERSKLLSSIREFDRDRDEAISIAEIPIVMDLIVCQSSAAIDQEVQSETTAAQSMRTSNPDKPVPAWFASMDGNGYGVISKDEFLGSTTQFSKLDKDNNGWIDLNESE